MKAIFGTQNGHIYFVKPAGSTHPGDLLAEETTKLKVLGLEILSRMSPDL